MDVERQDCEDRREVGKAIADRHLPRGNRQPGRETVPLHDDDDAHMTGKTHARPGTTR